MCLALLAAGAAGVLRAGDFLLPAVERISRDAALLAGAAAMPEGTAEAIRERFAGYVYSPEDLSPEEEIPLLPAESEPEPTLPTEASPGDRKSVV